MLKGLFLCARLIKGVVDELSRSVLTYAYLFHEFNVEGIS